MFRNLTYAMIISVIVLGGGYFVGVQTGILPITQSTPFKKGIVSLDGLELPVEITKLENLGLGTGRVAMRITTKNDTEAEMLSSRMFELCNAVATSNDFAPVLVDVGELVLDLDFPGAQSAQAFATGAFTTSLPISNGLCK